VYPTNPTEAHRLIDEGIKYYKNNESYTFPWLGHFYGAKAEYLSKEKKFKKSIIYQIKACEEHGKSRLFQDEVNQLENLLTCYAILSYSYSKDANYKELLNTTSTAIEIYESHENYYISENKNFYGYVTFLNLRNAAYDGLHDYGNAIKSNKKVITLLTKNGLKEKKAIELYIRTLKNLKNVYYDLGDSTNLDKYSVLHMDEAKKYYGDDNGKMIIIMEEEITMLLRGGYYKKAFEMNKKVRVIYADLLDNPGLDKKRKVEYTKALISALGTEDTMMKGFIDVNEMANIGLLNEILSLNNQLDMKDQNIEIYLDLIRFYNFQEDYRKIKVLFKKANILIDEQISYYEKHQKTLLVYFIDDKKRLLEVEAYYYLDTSEPKKALEIADNLKLLQSNSVGSSAVDSQVELKNLYGRIFKDLGKFKDSIKIYIEALDILNKSFEKNIDLEETVLNNLALSYAAIGNFKSASKYLKKLADNAEDVAIKEGVVTPRTDNKKMLAYNNYASSISKDNPGLSIKYLMKSYNINKNMNEMHRGIGFISTLNLISEHHISKKDFKTAEKYLKEGYSYAMRNISYTPRHLSNYIYLYSDMVAINNKDYDQCISLNEKFTQAYEAINNKSLALLPHYRMLKTCHQLKNDEELAFKYSYKIIKLIINEFDQNNLNLDFEISRTMKDNKYLVYLFIKDVLKHLNDDRSILDKYKGVDFFELMFKLQQIIKVNKLSVTLSQAISREMSEKKEVSLMIKNYSRLIKQRNSLIEIEISSLKKEYLKKRNNKLLKLDSKISKLKDNILKEYPDFQRNFVKQVVDISTLQETMGPDEAMIHLNLGALGMMLTTVTKEEIHLQTLTGTTNDRVKTEVTSIRNSIQLENNTPKIFDILSSSCYI
jgi:tetratricopeptide (TPR) repeat protein